MEAETNGSNAWRMGEAPKDYMRSMLDGIVAFKIDVQRFVGKSKLSQNREPGDYDNVAREMRRRGKTGLAQAMQKIAANRKE